MLSKQTYLKTKIKFYPYILLTFCLPLDQADRTRAAVLDIQLRRSVGPFKGTIRHPPEILSHSAVVIEIDQFHFFSAQFSHLLCQVTKIPSE